jgi:hypothetical protein
MKHVKPPIPAEVYYYRLWKTHSLRFILALAVMTASLTWAVVIAVFYSNATLCIGLVVVASFSAFVVAIKYRDCGHYHTRYLRALCDPSIINSDHVNQ